MSSYPYAIEMVNITKKFPGIIANDNVTLQLKRGEIHALLGENGAGKSTLMSVLFGLYQAEEGVIKKNGEIVQINNPNDANALGIGMVHQHFKLVDVFSAADNIWMGKDKPGLMLKKDRYTEIEAMAKKFGFGLDLAASYTYSKARSYGDGIGDQVNSAYYNNRYSVNGNNDMELGYGTYVAPNRLLISASFHKDYGKNFGTMVGLVYEGMNMGYAGGYSSTRYSYTLTSNVVNDYGSNNLIFIPESREALNNWKFSDYTFTGANGKETYTAEQQKNDFWNYINQDDYFRTKS